MYDKKSNKTDSFYILQVNNYEIIVIFFHTSHNLTDSLIALKFTRIFPVLSTYELAKQFVMLCKFIFAKVST